MTTMNRRAMIALAAAMAASPVFGQETTETTEVVLPEIKDFTLGDPDAPVKIIEYASFTCSHCATFHDTVFTQLKRDYIDTGKVHFTLREFYLNRYDLWAGMMARCGGDLKYFGITDILFSTQPEWAYTDDPLVVVDNLRKIGLGAGMTGEQLDVCMKDAANADAMIARFETNAKADEVTGTPTLFINGERPPSVSLESVKAAIDAALAG